MTTDLDIQLTATSDCPLVGVVMGSDSDWPKIGRASCRERVWILV